ncbi:hypothetical protein N7523_000045 [Penicillium sp. IBT 18751x]|nr:hypothetical protein N7523_000045 [Penicillium sp. IBT 18751x]
MGDRRIATNRIAVDPDVYASEGPCCPADWHSETTSIGSSSIHRGRVENGRRYQTLRRQGYLMPSDEQMFESYEAGHLVALVLDSDRTNPLFWAPVHDPQHILDLGTGKGIWAIDVADMFPNATIRGVDLFPPPISWMPPNCVLEVDDVLQEWTWRDPFDLIHMRSMIGSFDPAEWDRVYNECYNKLQPGGWIEQLEASPRVECDDGSLPEDNIIHTWAPNIFACGEAAGRRCDTIDTMYETIRKAGFVDVREKTYKWPIGPWARDQRYKEAGTVNFQHWMSGMEGWSMWLLTKFGAPEPWTQDEVLVYVARLRKELKNPRFHLYQRARRVWARKPFPGEIERSVEMRERSACRSDISAEM